MARHSVIVPSTTMPNVEAEVIILFNEPQGAVECHAKSQWGTALYKGEAGSVDDFIKPLATLGITLPADFLEAARQEHSGSAEYVYVSEAGA